ncbi:hypothetical protein HY844_00020 [Candidatus Berkelbacteria bacterium]|nr:hypothetical protein [Candidatus Berkelbacteria bacterium]
MTTTQLGYVAKLCEQHSVDKDRADALFKSGLLSDLLAVENPAGIDREAFQKLLTAKPKRRRIPKGLVDSELLEPVTTVSVGRIEAFSAREMMSEGTRYGVKIYKTWDNFKKHFLNLNRTGKNELEVPAQKLRVHKLRKNSKDGPIFAELGGETVVETNLATMYELMKKQGIGQGNGPLLVDGKANIFYIKDDNGILLAVCCLWIANYGWYVGADAISRPDDWDAGDQVFSR